MIPILIPLWLALRPLLSVVLASILLVALGLAVSGAEDAIITVNSASDSTNSGDGDCTLREAIINANSDSDLTKGDCTAGSADDTIQFNLSSGSEIKLAGTALPTITHRLTLDGSPSQNLTISAENKSRLFVIGYSTDVTITHVAIANGQENWGAGILNDGQLVLLNTSFENNSAGIEPAGAIYNRNGSLVVRGSTFFSNSSWQGGAIMSSSGPVNIYSSTFEDNSALYGGAVYNSK